MLSYYEENNIQLPEALANIKNQIFPTFCPIPTKCNTSINNPSLELVDQQVFFDNIQDEKHQPSISITDSQDFPNSKEVGTQTESNILLSIVDIDQRRERRSAHRSLLSGYRNIFCPQQFLLLFLLIIHSDIVIHYHLLTDSTTTDNINSTTTTKLHMVSINVICQGAIALFFGILPLSSILNGPNRSSFELWFYPFTVP
ncbi:unnamed protein product [Rotaria sp. Silwood2]|nr:unnamed protein product [Rotaria sp. Silwood2]CAF3456911.1 unnamed protein product [Rotaria sp. Silwood2]CAF4282323.1 unnamed protein product [Rotaria sp. Silwood2]CAF4563516.1 unnamed protein product [Rotaria sp. Silwood2]CAF4636586.1 unnamed protein product [Rotaria sp. Silwood2]